jgi:hypothetical protein
MGKIQRLEASGVRQEVSFSDIRGQMSDKIGV